jgi:toxin-antitoxin system PIN domain toxin
MSLTELAYLPDVNVLVALSDPSHVHHRTADNWRQRIGIAHFLLCPITESGYVRLMANPIIGGLSMNDAILLLQQIAALPNCENLPIECSWLELIQPLAPRLHGYRQVTDAHLLGLAIRNGAVLVTLDRGIQALAGEAYAVNVLTLA